jgi:hypothetical protein
MHRSISILGLILLGLLAGPAAALSIVPEVSISLERLPEDRRPPLEGLAEQLERYLGDHDWDPEEPRLELRFPLVIQFMSAADNGPTVVYNANFAASNGGDIQLDEGQWRFRLDPYAQLQHDEENFDPFTGMIDYHIRLLIAHEYDKLAEFGGDEQFARARRISDLAMFSEFSDGWSRRREKLDLVLDPSTAPLRTLRWATHLAFWFRQVAKNDFEAWNTLRIAVDLAEEIDNPALLASYWKTNHQPIAELLVAARDDETLTRLTRIDNMDPLRTGYYQDRIAELLR